MAICSVGESRPVIRGLYALSKKQISFLTIWVMISTLGRKKKWEQMVLCPVNEDSKDSGEPEQADPGGH